MCERFMKRIAIITARGGSKRIPLKNIKDFCGKPVIVYSIASACKSSIFDTVMVSTDSRQIADIAKAAGAEVPFLRSAPIFLPKAKKSVPLQAILYERKNVLRF